MKEISMVPKRASLVLSLVLCGLLAGPLAAEEEAPSSAVSAEGAGAQDAEDGVTSRGDPRKAKQASQAKKSGSWKKAQPSVPMRPVIGDGPRVGTREDAAPPKAPSRKKLAAPQTSSQKQFAKIQRASQKQQAAIAKKQERQARKIELARGKAEQQQAKWKARDQKRRDKEFYQRNDARFFSTPSSDRLEESR